MNVSISGFLQISQGCLVDSYDEQSVKSDLLKACTG